jgi:hypothetical protein
MGSGLTAGDAYPIKATTPSTGTATIENTSTVSTGTTTSLRVSSITATTGDALNIIFSTGIDGDDTANYTWDSTVIGFFWSSTDTRVRQEYYYQASTQLVMDGALTNFDTITTPTKNGALTSTTNQSGVTVALNIQTSANVIGDSMQFVLPYGATFGTTTFTFASGSDNFGTISVLSSTTRFYQFPTAWGLTTTVAGNTLTGGTVATQISAVNTRISDFTVTTAGKSGYVMNSAQGTAATDACTHGKAIDWATMGLADTTKTFTTCTISLTASNTQSAATKAFT